MSTGAGPAMRICSLIPGATDILVGLGLAQEIVAVSHECAVSGAAPAIVVRSSVSGQGASSAAIDRQVRTARRAGAPLYTLDLERLRDLAPDLIITQDLCGVCAVTSSELDAACSSLPVRPRVLTLQPTSLADVLEDIERVAAAVGRIERGRTLAADLRARLAAVEARVSASDRRPAVASLEWLDPLFSAGHWIPEMVRLAGGEERLGRDGRPSEEVSWEVVRAIDPEVLLLMPCGFGVERTMQELGHLTSRPGWTDLRAVRTGQVYGLDAQTYFSRPGPHLIDGVELLADVLHGTPRGKAGVVRLTSEIV